MVVVMMTAVAVQKGGGEPFSLPNGLILSGAKNIQGIPLLFFPLYNHYLTPEAEAIIGNMQESGKTKVLALLPEEWEEDWILGARKY